METASNSDVLCTIGLISFQQVTQQSPVIYCVRTSLCLKIVSVKRKTEMKGGPCPRITSVLWEQVIGTSVIALWVKILATNPDNLSLIIGRLLWVVLLFSHTCCGSGTHHILNKWKNTKGEMRKNAQCVKRIALLLSPSGMEDGRMLRVGQGVWLGAGHGFSTVST